MTCRRIFHLALVVAGALSFATSGCVTVSHEVRPHVLRKGDVRMGVSGGLTRGIGEDVNIAEPANRAPEEYLPIPNALFYEVNVFYGLLERLDVGLRWRPSFPYAPWHLGLKAEGLYQIVSRELDSAGFDLAIGLGYDAIYRPYRDPNVFKTKVEAPEATAQDPGGQHEVRLVDDGGFNLTYHGGMVDVPLVVAVPFMDRAAFLAAIRVGYLSLDATERYEPLEEGFETVSVDKTIRQVVYGVTLGLSFHEDIHLGEDVTGIDLQVQVHTDAVDVPELGRRPLLGGTFGGGFSF